MKSQKGSAVALVLLILGVISLIGVAALLQSRLDLRFATALQSYDKMFNLADGAAKLSLAYITIQPAEPRGEEILGMSDDAVTDGWGDVFPMEVPLVPSDHFLGKTSEIGSWKAELWMVGAPENRVEEQEIPMGLGLYNAYGLGSRPESLGEDAKSDIRMGVTRLMSPTTN
jgi:hypothetical protein